MVGAATASVRGKVVMVVLVMVAAGSHVTDATGLLQKELFEHKLCTVGPDDVVGAVLDV